MANKFLYSVGRSLRCHPLFSEVDTSGDLYSREFGVVEIPPLARDLGKLRGTGIYDGLLGTLLGDFYGLTDNNNSVISLDPSYYFQDSARFKFLGEDTLDNIQNNNSVYGHGYAYFGAIVAAGAWLPNAINSIQRVASLTSIERCGFSSFAVDRDSPSRRTLHVIYPGEDVAGISTSQAAAYLFVAKPLRTKSIFLGSSATNSRVDENYVVMAGQPITFAICPFGFCPSTFTQDAGGQVTSRVFDDREFLPIDSRSYSSQISTMLSFEERPSELGYASHIASIEGVSSRGLESAVVLIAQPTIFKSPFRLHTISVQDRLKAALVKSRSSNALHGVLMAGWDIPIVNRDRSVNGENQEPLAFNLLSPYRRARYSDYRNKVSSDTFAQEDYIRSVSAFCFLASSEELSEEDRGFASGPVGGVLHLPVPESQSTVFGVDGVISATLGVTSDGCMLEMPAEFDFGAKVVRSTLSTSIPFSSDSSSDLSFQPQEYKALNSESVIGVGTASQGIREREAIPSRTAKPYRKPFAAKSYNSKTEQWQLGEFKSDGISLVELLSSAMLSGEAPLHDHNVEFPVIPTQSQASAFLFRGKRIVGTGVQFFPWSSNSFFSEEAGGPLQEKQPDLGPLGDGTGHSGNDWVLRYDGVLVDETVQTYGLYPAAGETKRLYSKRFGGIAGDYELVYGNFVGRNWYSCTRWFANIASRPLTKKTYLPNVAYDEQGFMAGTVCNLMPSPNSIGLIKNKNDEYLPNIYVFPESNFSNRCPLDAYDGSGKKKPDLRLAAESLRPSLEGKEFVCTPGSIAGRPLQAGAFHFLGKGRSFEKSISLNFKGLKDRIIPEIKSNYWLPQYTRYFFDWNGSETHTMTFDTDVVEIYVKWSASLQSPGPYKVSPPYPATFDETNIETGPSKVAPRMFVKTSDIENVTPILVAEVWVRAAGGVSVSSQYTMPEQLGTSGTYTQGAVVSTPKDDGPIELKDISSARLGHAFPTYLGNYESFPGSDFISRHVETSSARNPVPSSIVDFRYLGAMPFNREQTRRLLNGEEVEPTYWFLDDEGSALESQPICVAWHNPTFGTYKLKFRLITQA